MTYSLLTGGKEGHWSPSTSLIDWCEENYTLTLYIAEFFNTISNAAFIIFASIGLNRSISHKLDVGFILGYASLIIVGIGSLLFHATLWFEMQLLDEVPMIFCAAIMLYCCLINYSIRRRKLILLALLFFSGTSIFTYLVTKKPWIHQSAFGVLTAAYSILMIPIAKNKNIQKLIKVAVVVYGIAFLLWNVDNLYCQNLRSLRNTISDYIDDFFNAILPIWDESSSLIISSILTSFLQLHSWWHVISAWAGYVGFCCLEYVVRTNDGENLRMKFLFRVVPMIVSLPKSELPIFKVVVKSQYPKKRI